MKKNVDDESYCWPILFVYYSSILYVVQCAYIRYKPCVLEIVFMRCLVAKPQGLRGVCRPGKDRSAASPTARPLFAVIFAHTSDVHPEEP